MQKFKVISLFCVISVGEKLDYKSCESLEEIFKRVQFKVVDLEQTNLDEDVSGVFFFFYPIEFFTNLMLTSFLTAESFCSLSIFKTACSVMACSVL